MHEIVDTV